jgi:hypothetical protein
MAAIQGGMQDYGKNLGQTCRKKAATPKQACNEKAASPDQACIKMVAWSMYSMQEDGSNLGHGCRKKAAIQGRNAERWKQSGAAMQEDCSNPGQACIKVAATQGRHAGRWEFIGNCSWFSLLSRNWVNSKLIRRGLGNRWMK